MVRKLVSLLKKRTVGLHDAALLLAAFSVGSQVLGIIRDRMLAHLFGASAMLDVYYAAFRIPDFIFISVASLMSMFVLIPLLTEYMTKSLADARAFLSSVISTFFVGISVVSAVIFFLVPSIVKILYPDLLTTHPELILIARILLLSPILLGLSNICASVTQITRQFFVYGLSPLLYNIGIILGVIWLYPLFGLPGLAWGVIGGALLHFIIQIPVLHHERLLPRLTTHINWRTMGNIVTISLPRTTALALNHAVLLTLIAFASRMAEGSITVFTFAQNIMLAPVSIIGVSYSVAVFPLLSKLFTDGNRSQFMHHIATALRHIIFWSFPVTVLLIVFRAHIVRLLLGSGVFDWSDTRLTAAVLALFIISLIAQGVVLLFVRAYYAWGNTRRPLMINTIASVVTIFFAYVLQHVAMTTPFFNRFLEELFRVSDVPGTLVLVLPLAYSLGMICNWMLFAIFFKKDFGSFAPDETPRQTLQHVAVASFFAGIVSYGILNISSAYFDLETFLGLFGHGALAGVVGVVVWAGILLWFKNRELLELWNSVHQKFWKTKPLFPDSEMVS